MLVEAEAEAEAFISSTLRKRLRLITLDVVLGDELEGRVASL